MTLLDASPAGPSAPLASACPTPRRPGLRDVPRVRLALSQVTVIAPLTVAHVAHVGVTPGLATAGTTVAVTASFLPVRHALATAVVAWAWLTAFVVHTGVQDGRLSFADADLDRLGVLAAVAVLGVLLGRIALRSHRSVPRLIRPGHAGATDRWMRRVARESTMRM